MLFHSYNQNESHPEWRSLIKHKDKLEDYAKILCQRCDINIGDPLDLDVLAKIQEKLRGQYQFIILDFKTGTYPFTGIENNRKIYLLYSRYTVNGHYDYIKSMTGYFNRSYYCHKCNAAYQRPTDHRCPGSCYLCRAEPECVVGANGKIKCPDCRISYMNSECLQRHIDIKICKCRSYCDLCEVLYIVKKNHDHKCGEWRCNKCKEYYTAQPHYCYIKPLKSADLAEDDKIERIFVAFDIESMLIKHRNNVTEHVPIQICAAISCDNCWDLKSNWMADHCPHCLKNEMSWYGEDCVKRFNNYVINILAKKAEANKWQVLVVAHNLSGYDGHFILRDVMERELRKIEPVMKGNKIIKLEVANVRYIDSLLFFLQPLSALPKCFGLPHAKKGFFPHLKNTRENQELICLLRDIKDYEFDKDSMKDDTAKEFTTWYLENQDKDYNLKEEMKKYCENDVKILMQSLMKFRELFKKETKIDPLKRCYTLASVALEYFKANHLEENKIGVTPIEGYGFNRIQSNSGKAFLDFYDQHFGTTMDREHRTGRFWVDGYIDTPTVDPDNGKIYNEIAFEFLGKIYYDLILSNYNKST